MTEKINVGSVIIPNKILCEEGTSFHYLEHIEFAEPDPSLHSVLLSETGCLSEHSRIETAGSE